MKDFLSLAPVTHRFTVTHGVLKLRFKAMYAPHDPERLYVEVQDDADRFDDLGHAFVFDRETGQAEIGDPFGEFIAAHNGLNAGKAGIAATGAASGLLNLSFVLLRIPFSIASTLMTFGIVSPILGLMGLALFAFMVMSLFEFLSTSWMYVVAPFALLLLAGALGKRSHRKATQAALDDLLCDCALNVVHMLELPDSSKASYLDEVIEYSDRDSPMIYRLTHMVPVAPLTFNCSNDDRQPFTVELASAELPVALPEELARDLERQQAALAAEGGWIVYPPCKRIEGPRVAANLVREGAMNMAGGLVRAGLALPASPAKLKALFDERYFDGEWTDLDPLVGIHKTLEKARAAKVGMWADRYAPWRQTHGIDEAADLHKDGMARTLAVLH